MGKNGPLPNITKNLFLRLNIIIENTNEIILLLFQGVEIHNNAKKGVIVQHYSLALRKVNRFQAGNYMCVASNVEGDGYSDTVELKIMCKYTSFTLSSDNQYRNIF